MQNLGKICSKFKLNKVRKKIKIGILLKSVKNI